MNKTNKAVWIIGGLIVLILAAAAVYMLRPQLIPAALIPADPVKGVRATVVDFGASLKGVDALAPHATSTIATTFAPYVAPQLLSVWTEEPTTAPVRFGSEPWPQRIEIQSVEKQKDGTYWVVGFVIEQDKTGDYTNNKVTVVLEKMDGKWMITDFAGYPTRVHKPINTKALSDPKYQIPG